MNTVKRVRAIINLVNMLEDDTVDDYSKLDCIEGLKYEQLISAEEAEAFTKAYSLDPCRPEPWEIENWEAAWIAAER